MPIIKAPTTSGSPTKQFWIPVNYRNVSGVQIPYASASDFPYASVASGNNVRSNFIIPDDFSSVLELKAVVIPDATATLSWDANSTYAANTETYNTHTGSLSSSTAVTVDKITEIDISGGTMISNVAAGDYFNVRFSPGASVRVLGFMFKYL